jgi:hypothetical protein
MTTPETQGEVSPESMGKGHLQPLGAPQARNPPLIRTTGNAAGLNWLKPCRGKPFDPYERVEIAKSKRKSRHKGASVITLPVGM